MATITRNGKGTRKDLCTDKIQVIYLASGTGILHNHNIYNITYQDINGKRDIGGDMMEVDLSDYDIIIASPPCNWYSKINYRRNESEYALKTKHLLPDIIDKCRKLGKPYIIENVRSRFIKEIIKERDNDLELIVLYHGRHTYFTNQNFMIKRAKQDKENICQLPSKDPRRQGSDNVNRVFDEFLKCLKKDYIK